MKYKRENLQVSQIIVQVVGLHNLDNHWVMVWEAAGPNTGTDS